MWTLFCTCFLVSLCSGVNCEGQELETPTHTTEKIYSVNQVLTRLEGRLFKLATPETADSDLPSETLLVVVKLFLHLQQSDRALAVANKIPNAFCRNEARLAIGEFYSGTGQLNQSRELILQLQQEDFDEGSRLIVHAIESMCEQYRFDDALRLSAMLRDQEERSERVAFIAYCAENAGFHSLAEELAESLPAPGRLRALFDRAVESSTSAPWRSRCLLNRVVESLDELENDSERASLIIRVSNLYVILNERASADNLLSRLPNDAARSACLLARAERQARRGEQLEMRKSLESARQVAWNSLHERSVVVALAETGYAEEAVELLFEASEGRDDQLLIEFVIHPALGQNDFDGALYSSGFLVDSYAKAWKLLHCAQGMLRRKVRVARRGGCTELLAEVDRLAKGVCSPADRLELQASLAATWSEVGDDPRLRTLLVQLTDSICEPTTGSIPDAALSDRQAALVLPALRALGMQDCIQKVLKRMSPKSVIDWEVKELCRSGEFDLAVERIRSGRLPEAQYQLHDVILAAAKAKEIEWALNAIEIEGDDELTKCVWIGDVLERLVYGEGW